MPRTRESDATEVLRLKVALAEQREEILALKEANRVMMEGLRDQSHLFSKIKPQRLPIFPEKKLYIAGLQHFKCAAPHGKEKCPRWLLNKGSHLEGCFDEAGFEIDHATPYSVSYRNTELQALCFACHGLKSRLERIRAAEAKGVIDPLEEEE